MMVALKLKESCVVSTALDATQPLKGPSQPKMETATALKLKCPTCGKSRIVKAGVRYTTIGERQRVVCKDCSHRFYFPIVLNAEDTERQSSQQNNPCKELELLATLDQNATSAGIESQTVKGQILSYMFQMQKDGLQKTTI